MSFFSQCASQKKLFQNGMESKLITCRPIPHLQHTASVCTETWTLAHHTYPERWVSVLYRLCTFGMLGTNSIYVLRISGVDTFLSEMLCWCVCPEQITSWGYCPSISIHYFCPVESIEKWDGEVCWRSKAVKPGLLSKIKIKIGLLTVLLIIHGSQ